MNSDSGLFKEGCLDQSNQKRKKGLAPYSANPLVYQWSRRGDSNAPLLLPVKALPGGRTISDQHLHLLENKTNRISVYQVGVPK